MNKDINNKVAGTIEKIIFDYMATKSAILDVIWMTSYNATYDAMCDFLYDI